MKRRLFAAVAALLAAIGVLVAVGRWEERRSARTEAAGMRTVLAAIGGNIVSPSLTGYRFGPPDCLVYQDKEMLLALQLCFDQEGRLVLAVDRRPTEPRYYSLEYKPTLSPIRLPRKEIDELMQIAAAASA